MVGSWEVVIATLHTDLVHNLLVPLMSYVSIKPSDIIIRTLGLTADHVQLEHGLPSKRDGGAVTQEGAAR